MNNLPIETPRERRPVSLMDWRSDQILTAVQTWAAGCLFEPEIEVFDRATSTPVGRVDALFIPVRPELTPWHRGGWCWAQKLVAIEVKVSRADFSKGLKEGQFDRYLSAVNGVIVATPKGLIKTSELPRHIGHVSVFANGRYQRVAVCHRLPTLSNEQPSPLLMWKLFNVVHQQYAIRERELQQRVDAGCQRAGERLARAIFEAGKGTYR